MGRVGAWMETASGLKFYPLDPRPEEVLIEDLAHHLARINRYNGAIQLQHYSVAEHSYQMAMWLLQQYGDRRLALQGLLHDAPEAYIGDMVRPLKRSMPAFVQVEESIWLAVADRFGLPEHLDDRVKEADIRILVDERRKLMAKTDNVWVTDGLEPLGVPIQGWMPLGAAAMFHSAFNLLTSESVDI